MGVEKVIDLKKKKAKSLINIIDNLIIYHLLNNLIIDSNILAYIIYNDEYNKYNLEELSLKDYLHINFIYYYLLNNTWISCIIY